MNLNISENLDEEMTSYLTSGENKTLWAAKIFGFFTRGISLLSVGLFISLGWVIWGQASPAIKEFKLGFLISSIWNVGESTFGAAPYIYGSLISSALALLFAIPIGISVAIITSEDFLPASLRSIFSFLVELIAAIPSVIIGLWGIYVMIPAIKPLQMLMYKKMGWIPFFSTEPSGPSLLSAGLILAIMILPTIAAISRDVLVTVPTELTIGSQALGATEWETIVKVKLSVAKSGIIGAVMLGLGRALGETMAVTMVIGNSAQINLSLLDPAYSIPAVLANEFAEALDPLHIGSLMYLAFILLIITLTVNTIALLFIRPRST